MKKLIAILAFMATLIVLCMPTAGASMFQYRNQFNDSLTSENVTFNGTFPYYQVIWINVSRRANVTAASWNMTGYAGNETWYNGVTTTGSWQNPERVSDKDWLTAGRALSSSAYARYNFTNVGNYSGVTVRFKYGASPGITINFTKNITGTIYEYCRGNDSGNLYNFTLVVNSTYVGSALDSINFTCQNATGKETILLAYQAGLNTMYLWDANITFWTYPADIRIDIGSDSTNEYVNNTIWNTTSTVVFNATALAAINTYLKNTCTASWATGNCSVPFNISSSTNLGTLEISSVNITENLTFNFSIWVQDETSQAYMVANATTTNGTSTTDVLNITYNRTVDVDSIPIGSNTLYETSSGYNGRYYYFTNSRTVDTNLSTWMLSSSTGIIETIYVTTTLGTPISGTIITVQYPFTGGIYSTVEQKTTDSTGTALTFLNPSRTYHFVVSAGGYVSAIFDAVPNPSSPFIYVKLGTTGAGGANFVNFSTIMDSVSYRILPQNRYQNQTFNVSFEIADSISSLEYIGLNLTWSNGTLICDEYTNANPSGTLMYCTVPNTTGRYYIHAYFKKAGFNQVDIWGGGSIIYFVEFVQGLVKASETVRNAISDIGYWVVIIIITIVVCAAASRVIGGFPIAFLAVGIVAFGVAVNPAIMIAEVSGWLIVATMIITLVALMVIRSYI